MPGPGDDAIIPVNDSIMLNQAGFAGTLTVSASVTFTGNRTLAVTGAVTITSAAAVTFDTDVTAASLSQQGSLTVTSKTTVTVAGAVTMPSGSLAVQGTLAPGSISISGGTLLTTAAITTPGSVVLTGGALTLQGSATLNAASVSLGSAATLTVTFPTPTTLTSITASGNVALAGVMNVTGTTPADGSYTVATSTGGTVDITGLTLGNAPSTISFGFRTATGPARFILDVSGNQPIRVDSFATTSGTCATPLTWQHTVGVAANDRYMFVGLSVGAASAPNNPATVTYGTQSLVQIASIANGLLTSKVFIFGLAAPARGTHTITVTFDGSFCNVVAGSISYTGVNQGGPLGTSGGGQSSTGVVFTNLIGTAAHDKVFSVFGAFGGTSATPQGGSTLEWSAISGGELGAADTQNIPTGGNIQKIWNYTPAGFGVDAELAAWTLKPANPTAAREVATARSSPGGMAISLHAVPGSDLVGFRVWRELDGRRELLTPGLVAGPVLTTRATLLAGAEPGWVDGHPVPGARYLLESLHVDGSTLWSVAAPRPGKAPVVESALLAPTPSVMAGHAEVRSVPAVRRPASSRPTARDVQWELAASPAVKLVVDQAGMVRVTAESLFAAGVPVGTPVSALQLFREGHPVPRAVLAADGSTLRPGDALEFYGHGMDTRYSGSAVYWLRWERGSGVDLSTAPASASAATTTTFLAAAEIRERLTWFGAVRNGDTEKFFGPAVFSKARERTFQLDGLDLTGTGARLEVALQGVTDVPHAVDLTVNGLAVGTVTFDGQALGTGRIDLPPGVLVPGDNVVGLVAPGATDISLEQFVRIVYPRRTSRTSGQLELTLPAGEATVLDGFDAARTRVLDITDPDAPVSLATWSGSSGPAVVAAGAGLRRLVAYQREDGAPPSAVLVNQPSRWHASPGADLVILGPRALFPGIQPLADRRRAEGLEVALVDIEDVQDEFASGEKSAEAIRAFLEEALKRWEARPRWVLLLGSATYDPRDYLGLGGDMVPAGIVQTDALEAVSDSWFLDVPGARSVSIGRLPVRTVTEAEAVVAKILERRLATPRSPVLLVSDARGSSDFPEMSADVRAELPDAAVTVLERGSEPDDSLHQKFLAAARSGPALVNYVGHASELFWNGDLHTVADTEALAGGGTSLWLHMTCLTGFFQDPRRQSLAVATLLAPGGAWGAWGSTGMSYPSEHPALDRALVRELLLEGKTLGEATRSALAAVGDPDLRSTFVLLGDPSATAVARSTAELRETTARPAVASGCRTAGEWDVLAIHAVLVALWTAVSRRQSSRRLRKVG